MRLRALVFFALLLTAAAPLWGQAFLAVSAHPNSPDLEFSRPAPELQLSPAAPRMSAELALETYEQRYSRQADRLAEYTANTTIEAVLPDSAQQGEFVLKRHYVAPNRLQFTAVSFHGDKFVKSNVITRMLQSEVEHVEKQETAQTAITSANYKFSYKGMEEIEGRPVHVYNVKPRQKRPGLFRGRIYVDVASGSLRRAEGTLVKSPSFFIKKIDFVQDYADFNDFMLPVHMHSEAKARIIGRAVVDIFTRDYAPLMQTAQMTALPPQGGN